MNKALFVGMVSLLAACSGGTRNSNNNTDGGMQSGNKDLAQPANCTAETLQFVADAVMLPTSSLATDPTGYGFDFNGDESPENKLGSLLSILNSVASGSSGSPQSAVDQAIQVTGTFLILMEIKADSMINSSCMGLEVSTALQKPNADFNGNGNFTQTSYQSDLTGTITAQKLSTLNPFSADEPYTIQVKLPLVTGSPAVELTLTSAVVRGELDLTAPNRINEGRIFGAVKNKDLREKTLPAIAVSLTAILTGNYDVGTQDAIRNLLDKGNCGAALAGDDVIDTCELTDGVLASAFTPDLDLYSDTSRDADGNVIGGYGVYDPKVSAETSLDNDCLSFGVGFTAVKAGF